MTDAPDALRPTEVEPDAATQETDGKPKRRFRMGCMGLLICALLLMIVMLVCFKVYAVYALKSRVAELRAAGEPVTWDDVIATLDDIADAENAVLVVGPHLRMAISPWFETPVARVLRPMEDGFRFLGRRPSDERVRLLRLCMTENSALLAALHEAAALPRGRWTSDTNPDPHARERMQQREFPYRWSLAVLLKLECELRAAEGDAHGAAESVRALRRLASWSGACVDLAAFRQRAADGTSAAGAAVEVLALAELSADDLRSLGREFAAEIQEVSLQKAIRGERANLLWQTTSGRRVAVKRALGPVWDMLGEEVFEWVLSHVPGFGEMDALYGLNSMSEWVALLDLPMREVMHEKFLLRNRRTDESHRTDAAKFVCSAAMPHMRLIIDRPSRYLLRLHVVRTALAVEQFRVERGDWPETLADLVPDYLEAVPEDWLAREPSTISYARDATGVRLWVRQYWNREGLTSAEWTRLRDVSLVIESFCENKSGGGRRVPHTLQELVDNGDYESLPIDARTGKPYTYETNPADPEQYILGGFTEGMSKADYWKQDPSAIDWSGERVTAGGSVIYRLLNPELRGATQARFKDEVYLPSSGRSLHQLGYLPARLRELGFNEDAVESYERDFEEYRAAEERDRMERGLPPAPEVPADTREEPVP
jgi:hypothetical protein